MVAKLPLTGVMFIETHHLLPTSCCIIHTSSHCGFGFHQPSAAASKLEHGKVTKNLTNLIHLTRINVGILTGAPNVVSKLDQQAKLGA